ncbi:MAG: hypothetical protein NVS1B3_03010 [Candidatus Dormibacteraceae bacterium]
MAAANPFALPRLVLPLSAVALAVVAVLGLVWIGASLFSGGGRSPSAAPALTGSRQIYISSHGGTSLAATVMIPPHPAGTTVPAVLIVPGPWNSDRDGRESAAGLGNSPYRVLAEYLGSRGIATLRYDQRGVGDTRVPDPAALGGAQDLTDDASAALFALRAQPGVDAHRVGVLGHAAGGLLAMALAAASPVPAFVVLAETPGRPLLQDVRQHLVQHVLPAYRERGPELLAQFDVAAKELMDTGKSPVVDPALLTFFPPAHAQLLRELYGLNPAVLAGPIEVPILIFAGRLDPIVPVDDSRLLAQALKRTQHDLIVGQVTGHNLEIRPELTGDSSHDAAMVRNTAPDTDVTAVRAIGEWMAERLSP